MPSAWRRGAPKFSAAPAVVHAELASDDVWWDRVRINGIMTAFSSCLLTDAGEMKLDKLYVDPAYQRGGLGGMLIASGFGVAGVFLVTSIPQLCAAIAIFVMWRLHAGGRSPATAATGEAAKL